jgi:Fe-S oxidoreductase
MSMEYYTLDKCMQCGICSSSCPNGLVNDSAPFSPRTFIQRVRLGLLNLSEDELWKCTHCGNCQMVCPYEIPFLDVMNSLRNLVIEQGVGHVPISIRSALASIASCGNPWKTDAAERIAWLQQLDIPRGAGDPETTVYLFLGCMAGYDQRSRRTAETAMRLLARAGIAFEILAAEEVCCGDSARRVGDFATFNQVKQTNKQNFVSKGVRTIYTLSPHCYESIHNLYEWDESYKIRVIPFLTILHQWMVDGTFSPKKELQGRVTFHDPCFFSKHLGLVDEPRQILECLPGLEYVEMEHYGKKSLCCGGGGGGIWRDTARGERLAELRLAEALRTGADRIITSCPYCQAMLEDARKGDETFSQLEIMDICELVWKGITV